MVPKITILTAGPTTFSTFLKRKLDYSSTGKIVRKVQRGEIISVQEQKNQSKMFYHVLPDDVVDFFAAKGEPEGPTGYIQPGLRALTEAHTKEDSRWKDSLNRLQVTSVLPVRDLNTGQVKKLHFANGTKTMDVKCIVYIFYNVSHRNENNCNDMCTNLVREFNTLFLCKLSFGGNAAIYGSLCTSMDEQFFNWRQYEFNNDVLPGQHYILIFFDDEILVCK